MDVRLESRKLIHVTNHSAYDVLVMATPNKDWSVADIGFSFVSSAVLSALMPTKAASGGAVVASQASKLTRTINSARTLYSAFGKARKIYSAMDALKRKEFEKQQDYVADLFRRMAVTVPRGEMRMINEKVINPFDKIKSDVPVAFTQAVKDTAGPGTSDDLVRTAGYAGTAKSFMTNLMNLSNPSQFMAIVEDVADITLFIATTDFSRMTCFNSNSGHSWIVEDQEIVRAEPDRPDQANRSLGWQIFSNMVGSVLAVGEYLEPGDSLDIQTVNYGSEGDGRRKGADQGPIRTDEPTQPVTGARTDLPTQVSTSTRIDNDQSPQKSRLVDDERDAGGGGLGTLASDALREGEKLVRDKVIDPAIEIGRGFGTGLKTVGSSPYKLYYRPDGNLVLYKIAGDSPQERWSTGTAGQTAWRVVMETDGNLVVYSAPGKIAWSLWKKVPGNVGAGAYIALDRITGDIGFHNSGMDTPDFFINKLSDRF